MSKQVKVIARDRGVRRGDISADTDTLGIVTITIGTGDDHQHLELTNEQALTLADVLAGLTNWHGED